jgi:hypothetical protein
MHEFIFFLIIHILISCNIFITFRIKVENLSPIQTVAQQEQTLNPNANIMQ